MIAIILHKKFIIWLRITVKWENHQSWLIRILRSPKEIQEFSRSSGHLAKAYQAGLIHPKAIHITAHLWGDYSVNLRLGTSPTDQAVCPVVFCWNTDKIQTDYMWKYRRNTEKIQKNDGENRQNTEKTVVYYAEMQSKWGFTTTIICFKKENHNREETPFCNHGTFFQVHQKKYFQRGDRETLNTIERRKLDMSTFSRKSEGITARRRQNFLRLHTRKIWDPLKFHWKKNQGEIWRNTENNENIT